MISLQSESQCGHPFSWNAPRNNRATKRLVGDLIGRVAIRRSVVVVTSYRQNNPVLGFVLILGAVLTMFSGTHRPRPRHWRSECRRTTRFSTRCPRSTSD